MAGFLIFLLPHSNPIPLETLIFNVFSCFPCHLKFIHGGKPVFLSHSPINILWALDEWGFPFWSIVYFVFCSFTTFSALR